MKIQVKHVNDSPLAEDGYRVLIARRWPDGTDRDSAKIYTWHWSIAPSYELDDEMKKGEKKWEELADRYLQELRRQSNRPIISHLVHEAINRGLTLLYSDGEPEKNVAAVLKKLLETRIQTLP
ncbi:MAG: DUF488 domain-containing protein [Candidatus Ranarchaeia archaeon]